MSRILVSGASGFIGKPLVDHLASQGHDLVCLIRSGSFSRNVFPSIVWNPKEGVETIEPFEGFDAVIHLAGESLALGRWTRERKEKILSSRTVGTSVLSRILSELREPPKLFLSASAIGYYGNRGEEWVTEESEAGSGFLAGVCTEWEAASRLIEERGTRTIHARFGVVLGAGGGALEKMAVPFRFGLGGRIGTGKQWMSWIEREDLIRSIDHILLHESLKGPVNIVSPHPVRQEEFARTLANLLNRPAFLCLPKWLLHFCLGQLADEMLLSSVRVKPAKLLATGFSFKRPYLIDALRKALK